MPVGHTISPKKLETGLRPNSAGISYILLLRIEAIEYWVSNFWAYPGTTVMRAQCRDRVAASTLSCICIALDVVSKDLDVGVHHI